MNKRLKQFKKPKTQTSTTRAFTTDRAPILQVKLAQGTKIKTVGNTVHVIVSALENPAFKWRTVEGVAKEAGVDPHTVQRVFRKLGEQVVRSNVPSTSGEELFTTRQHLRQKESIFGRFGAVLRNRAS